MTQPGKVVVVDFQGVAHTKRRPVVVISSDLYHSCRPDVVVSLLTTKLSDATDPTDYILQDWKIANLTKPTAFRCFILTMPRNAIHFEVGQLSDRDWQEVKSRVSISLAVS